MRRFVWALLALAGCGGEGLTVRVSTPLVVGGRTEIRVTRCIKRELGVFDCKQHDPVSNVRISVDDTSVLALEGSGAVGVKPGVAKVTVVGDTSVGELTEVVEVDVVAPAGHRYACRAEHAGRCVEGLAWVPGHRERVESLPPVDGDGGVLLGSFSHQVSGPLEPALFSQEADLEAVQPGVGELRPVPDAVRAVNQPLRFVVVAPSDVVALHFATEVSDENGVLRSPMPLVPQTLQQNVPVEATPVLELVDGGWARPVDDSVTRDGAPVTNWQRRTNLFVREAGAVRYDARVGDRTLSVTYTVQ